MDDGRQAAASYIAGLEKKTGLPLDHWIQLVQSWGAGKHMELVKRLKEEHGISHGYANMVVHMATGESSLTLSDNELVAEMFKGKEHWKPVQEQLLTLVKELDATIECAPKKKYMSLRTKKQMALLVPATKGRYEIQFNLKGEAPTERLLAMKAGGMCTHRIDLLDPSALGQDEALLQEIKHWLQEAYHRSKA